MTDTTDTSNNAMSTNGWDITWSVTDGFNGAFKMALLALQHLAGNDRPAGGSDTFNSEHLQQIAEELVYSVNVIDRAIDKLVEENDRLRAALNTPEVEDFAKAVVSEAQHQRERWPEGHDSNKTDSDWFWLIGYLAGKALHNPASDLPPREAKLHRIIALAAAAANWHEAAKQSD